MSAEKLKALKERYEQELRELQAKINETATYLNQLQVMLIDRRGKLEVIDELLNELGKSQ